MGALRMSRRALVALAGSVALLGAAPAALAQADLPVKGKCRPTTVVELVAYMTANRRQGEDHRHRLRVAHRGAAGRAAVVKTLNNGRAQVLAMPQVREFHGKGGYEAGAMSPEDFASSPGSPTSAGAR